MKHWTQYLPRIVINDLYPLLLDLLVMFHLFRRAEVSCV